MVDASDYFNHVEKSLNIGANMCYISLNNVCCLQHDLYLLCHSFSLSTNYKSNVLKNQKF